MGVILVPKRRTTQPRSGAVLDPGNDVARAFDTFISFAQPSRNVYRPTLLVTNTVSGWGSDAHGAGIRSAGAGHIAVGAVANYTTGGFFVACRIRPTSLTGDPVVAFKGTYGGTGYYLQLTSAGVVYLYCGSAFVQTAAGAVAVGRSSVIVARVNIGSTGQIFIDGVDATSYSWASLTPTSSSTALSLLAYNTSSNRFSGLTTWYGSGNIYPSDTLVARISANPWEMFKPERKLVPVAAAASGLPTLSAAGMTGITTTGGYPTVSYAY